MDKRDWGITMFGLGMREVLPEFEAAARSVAGEYYMSPTPKKIGFIRSAKGEVGAAIALLQELNVKLDAELVTLEEASA